MLAQYSGLELGYPGVNKAILAAFGGLGGTEGSTRSASKLRLTLYQAESAPENRDQGLKTAWWLAWNTGHMVRERRQSWIGR